MKDIWQNSAESNKPLLLYGMGLGGDKIFDVCEKKGLKISDVFASPGFVRGQLYHGRPVISYSDACRIYGDFIVFVSFGSHLPDVIADIMKIASEKEVYIPSVPVSGGEIFDSEFYAVHEEEFAKSRELFSDEASKMLFDDMISFYLSGSLTPLMRYITTPDEVYSEILKPKKYITCCDMGAYNGDSVREFMSRFPNLRKIISFEPDAKNFKRLEKTANEFPAGLCEIYNAAAWDSNCILPFTSEGSRNSSLGSANLKTGNQCEISARTLDSVVSDRKIDYIKYDVEGSEREALIGSVKTISESRPDMLVSAYHRSDDLIRLPKLIKTLNRSYSLYLRRYNYIPAWDLNIFAVADK